MIPPLPLDILIHILYQLSASRDEEGDLAARAIAQCSAVDSLFRAASLTPTLWQRHYRARFLYANEASERQREAETHGDWKEMYYARRMIDQKVSLHLGEIVQHRTGRYEHVKSLTNFRFDTWDMLEFQTGMMEPSDYLKIYDYGSDVSPSLLATRAHWASALQAAIGRMHATELWGCLRLGSQSVPFVQAFSATSCFFGKHPDVMKSMLAALTPRCTDYVVRSGVPLAPDDPKYDLKKLCTLICDFMTSEGFGPATAGGFHDVHNLLPHLYLAVNKHTIPLSLVHIFVAIARSMGIAASPVDFPVRVLVHISVPNPDLDDFYVDVFGASVQPILTLREDIPAILTRRGIPVNRIMYYISPATSAPMLLRNGRNILTSLDNASSSMGLLRSSTLLGLSLFLALSGSERFVDQFMAYAEPLDCATFISEALIPSLEGCKAAESLSEHCQKALETEARMAKVVKVSTTRQYFVGMVFEHKKYGYTAVITGWDPVCAASDTWISQMKVDDLHRGRTQPFYTVVCMDNSSRYVAEDNIRPLINPSTALLMKICKSIRVLPHFFTGVIRNWKEDVVSSTSATKTDGLTATTHYLPADEEEWCRARFTLNPELCEMYPEDEALGDAWLLKKLGRGAGRAE
ncbi:hypothetical protein D9757_004660 [Collybiopsis confluens]|uniref:Hemimethylated DNA-binding domain-containing protein n=1 Tax=Collybiopsis confluens TaxID=2823264 RepID=A0A8H5HSS9_9AGAR|nr:hypothetical protein D9757_004660 [Collybiopsis confluens]